MMTWALAFLTSSMLTCQDGVPHHVHLNLLVRDQEEMEFHYKD